MTAFCTAVFLLLCCTIALCTASIDPNYLDMLLLTRNYEKFSEVTGLPVHLVKPGPGSSDNPMFNKGLKEGDIIPSTMRNEQGRQNIKDPNKKWNGEVPVSVSASFFFNRRSIDTAKNSWNNNLGDCIPWVSRNQQTDYVYVFPGNGCYSYLGRQGGMQMLSLQMPGCLSQGTIQHEMEHAVGFTHEHNRGDRDDNLKVLWENIPPQWQAQYEKNDDATYGLVEKYDYDSVMHYPLEAPDSGGKPAFELPPGIDGNRLGQREGPTQTDLAKIRSLYCAP